MDDLIGIYLQNNTWLMDNGEVHTQVSDRYGHLNWSDFMILCYQLLTRGKKFGVNFSETKKLLNFNDVHHFTYNDFKNISDLYSLIYQRYDRCKQKVEQFEIEKKQNNGRTTFSKMLSMIKKKEKLNGLGGWYMELRHAYSLIWANFLTDKYLVVQLYPGILNYIEPIVSLSTIQSEVDGTEMDVIKEKWEIGPEEDNVGQAIANQLLPQHVLVKYVRSFEFLLKMQECFGDNYTASYYNIQLIEDPELSRQIAEKLWLCPEIDLKILFEPVKPDPDIDLLLQKIFGHYFTAFEQIGPPYGGTVVGQWLYSGYFYYLHISKKTNKELGEQGLDLQDLLLHINQACYLYDLCQKHPLSRLIDYYFHPPSRITYSFI